MDVDFRWLDDQLCVCDVYVECEQRNVIVKGGQAEAAGTVNCLKSRPGEGQDCCPWYPAPAR